MVITGCPTALDGVLGGMTGRTGGECTGSGGHFLGVRVTSCYVVPGSLGSCGWLPELLVGRLALEPLSGIMFAKGHAVSSV